MVNYIGQIAKGILIVIDEVNGSLGRPTTNSADASSRLRKLVPEGTALLEELRRLDPRDFLPSAQYDFVMARLELEMWRKQWGPDDTGGFVNQFFEDPLRGKSFKENLEKIIKHLGMYGGEGWRAETRTFSFIKDAGLQQIVVRDYKELALVLFPGGAWKSTVIMAGSILEAVLFDQLTSDPVINSNAIASSKAPRDKKGAVLDVKDWNLAGMITVAVNIGRLPINRGNTFDQVLRDYRNFVHPNKEIRAGHPCNEGEAQLAIGGLNAVHDFLEKP